MPYEYEYFEENGGGTYIPPSYQSGDWARIADLANGRTEYRSVNFAAKLGGSSDLNGTFGVLAVGPTTITLANPGGTNTGWAAFTGETALFSPRLSTAGERWVGPFIVDQPGLSQIVANFYAPQGVYRVDQDGKDRARSVSVQLEVTPVDENGAPTGAASFFNIVIGGNGEDKSPKGRSMFAATGAVGRCQVRARRTTSTYQGDKDDTVVDEVRWRDAYGTAPVAVPHFGDVTTVHTRTYATAGAMSVKERKLNCRVTRRVAQRNADNTFGPALVASRSAADIICHMALDPYIGDRNLNELDVPQIYNTVAEVVAYFGFPEAGQFNYTFDQDNVSFEEMVQTVCQAVFCNAYRQGNKLRLFFERETQDSTLLFNHRNKLPGSETRTVRFGRLDNNDGVEFDYISPVDGAKLTLYLPQDQTATKPKKLERIGVQDERVAFLHASRAWNKIQYQHTATEFRALPQASQLVLSERIEVADNTRPDVHDGYVVNQDGLVLELSQPFVPKVDVGYVIFIQMVEGGLESIPVVIGEDAYHVVLQAPTTAPLVFDEEAAMTIAYQIVGDDVVRASAFIVTEKGAFDKQSLPVQAINYDQRYYQADQTYTGGA